MRIVMGHKITKLWPANSAKNPDAVLEQSQGEFDYVLIIGWDKEGCLDARSNLGLSNEQALWLVEEFKFKLIHGDYDE